jgi:hypothetical protein
LGNYANPYLEEHRVTFSPDALSMRFIDKSR